MCVVLRRRAMSCCFEWRVVENKVVGGEHMWCERVLWGVVRIIGEKVNSWRNEVDIMVSSGPLNKIYKCQLQECKIGIIEW